MTDLSTFDPAADAFQQCPFRHYELMRDESPVLEFDGASVGRPGERVFAVSRYEDVERVLYDWRTFSSRFGSPAAKPSPELKRRLLEVAEAGWPNVSTMLTEDPPSHTRYRRLVSKAFTPSRIRGLSPEIEAICQELVAEFDTPAIDFLHGFAVPLPVRAVAVVLEVPDTRQADFKRWADSSIAAIGRQITDDDRVGAEHDIVQQQQYFAAELQDRIETPRDDFLSALTQAELNPEDGVEGGPLSMAEMLSIIRQIQVAGSETTTGLLCDLMLMLEGQDEAWSRMREDVGFTAQVVEEGLRIASPNQGLFRITTADTEIAGVRIPAGSTIWVMFGSANRDEREFLDPDDFTPDRPNVAGHVAFGKG
ncbi:MAG: cytochrome P450, partial [Acidimicrobiales bacterium]